MADNLHSAERLAAALFDELARETRDDPGVTRTAYGDGENFAFRLVAKTASEYGAECVFDAAGNQFLTLPGQDRSRRLVIGSHLDSVPHGGNFDGAAGVILGIAAQAALADAGITPPCDITVACLRAEESCWFPHSYIGSKTALGRLEPGIVDQVRRSDTGMTLAEHLDEAGFDARGVREGASFLKAEGIVAYIEPHIEQAPYLLSEDLPLAAVSGIRGSFRYRNIKCRGEYSHSGAMPRNLRRDAGLAGARLIAAMHDYWDEVEARKGDLTVTFGEIRTDAAMDGFSKVPGDLHLCLDVRSEDQSELDRAEQRLIELAREIGTQAGVTIELGARSGSRPAVMASHLVSGMADMFGRLQLPRCIMASGAGHDAATFAQAGVPSVMMFIRNANGSHNPDEHMELSDFNLALAVLFRWITAPDATWLVR